ncbi:MULTISPECIES: Bug family tripartite tricarboxylate transporter substrate binding protein [Alcaligenaceae]|uniref:Secreted protein n=1 Tax=Bordetella petrii (strain ATCC BAA-461 / DSM 12804 / CCUG 43448 / CIP 107267 / Se-1111R) TaxID=340100 RepID=A9ICF3_BORPD|nr:MULTISPECIES: tripartite tricarboxylate transporter substrate binding protein [Alcaligenaceae]CAP41560.1 putative secreted protein [Bordetella petrii]CUJ31265.1 Argininosuccinate lyase [Achromobacter xylosoxidans]CUJ71340.1 Argininosuccinate lyase [Achromobacter xylosoxidans]
MRLSINRLLSTIVTVIGLAYGLPSQAAQYPDRPIRLITPYAAGGLSDILARTLANELAKRLGQSVVVENRTGAGGIIATNYVAKSDPDGYTLALVGQGLAAVNPTLHKDLPYDTLRDFAPISMIAKFSMVLVGNPQRPPESVAQMIDMAKKKPGSLNFGSAGNASTAHLMTEMLNDQEGIKMVHVPYKGESAAFTEVIGGRIDVLFGTVGGALPLIQSGKLRPLAIVDTQRNPLMPNVPTIEEAGVKDFNVFGWYGILAPKKAPSEVVNRLAKAFRDISQDPAFQKAMRDRGMESIGSTPAELETLIEDEIQRWSNVIKKVGIQAE